MVLTLNHTAIHEHVFEAQLDTLVRRGYAEYHDLIVPLIETLKWRIMYNGPLNPAYLELLLVVPDVIVPIDKKLDLAGVSVHPNVRLDLLLAKKNGRREPSVPYTIRWVGNTKPGCERRPLSPAEVVALATHHPEEFVNPVSFGYGFIIAPSENRLELKPDRRGSMEGRVQMTCEDTRP